MTDIHFGTDGWRGVIAEDFNIANARSVVQAIMGYIGASPGGGRVAVGYDNRFMSEVYARAAAEIVAGNGGTALVSSAPVTTPMLSHAVKSGGCAGGVMVTASHNPCIYNGIKFKASYGGSATKDIASAIEALIGKSRPAMLQYDSALAAGKAVERDFFPGYLEHLLRSVDTETIGRSGIRAVVDCMHGSSGHYAARLWDSLGLEARVLHAGRDPYFGGTNPEPVEANLSALVEVMRGNGYDLGIALDGDADRFTVVDSDGSFVTPHQVFALLMMHLRKNRKLDGLVVKTVSTSTLIDRLAADLGLKVVETPVGFKHICAHMLNEDVLIGGEENGGIGFKGYLPERDGLLSSLMLVEMMAAEGRGLRELLSALEKRYGPHCYRRLDLKLSGPVQEPLCEKISDRAAEVYRDFGVRQVRAFDGVKVLFDDGSWILFRLSGTEPLLRVYCEAGDPSRLELLLDRAKEAFLG
ncbi:MAG: phosphoglucomutase/phosphomannomutase family protein [Nitrospirae bacterium]|nr:phosphoglucomutase/phosphomannomutase family protein [Nitrospirota bacterium]